MRELNYNFSGGKQLTTGSPLSSLIASGSIKYDRRLHLRQLLPVTEAVIEDMSRKNCRWILSRLATALRQERNRGRRNHWAYSLNRHIGLLQAFRGEQRYLENLKSAA
jgi:hypothetical protein